MENEETITVSLKHYNSLVSRNNWLYALEDAGLDNWAGIDYAYELYEGEDE